MSQREAVFTQKQVKETALKHVINSQSIVSNEGLNVAIKEALTQGTLYNAKSDIDGNIRYTTPWQLTLESESQAMIEKGRDSCASVCSIKDVSKELKRIYKETRFTPTTSQKNAIESLLTTKDRFIAIQGFAGTGKTKMVTLISEIAEKNGITLLGTSPSATASKELSSKGGIQSDVLIKKLSQLEKDKSSLENTILILDESSMVSSQHFHLITKLIDERGGRLCFLGDKEQCPSPSSGKDFELMQDYSANTIYVTDFIRFKDEGLKQAATAMVSHDIYEALDKLSHVEELPTHDERIAYMANKWLSSTPAEREKTYLVALSHKDRKQITSIIRSSLINDNQISKDEVNIDRLVRSNGEGAKVHHTFYYKENQVVLFNKAISVHRIKAGEYLTVGEITQQHIDTDTLPLKRESGTTVTFKLKNLPELKQERSETDRPVEVYNKEPISLRIGDKVMWKKNNAKRGIENSDLGTVKAIDKDNVTIKNAKQDITLNLTDKALLHIDHGYVLTVNASQGKDNADIIGLSESGNKYGATFPNNYVLITRGINSVTLVTDNKENLIKQIQLANGYQKTSALENVSLKTLKMHEQRFKSHSKAIDIKGVISKKEQLDKSKTAINDIIEKYRHEKEAGSDFKAYKYAKIISCNEEALVLSRKVLTYSSNEIHKDILRYDIAKAQSSLDGKKKQSFLTVKNYTVINAKIRQVVKQLDANKSSLDIQKLNKEKMFGLIKKRDELAFSIVNNLDDHREHLNLFSIGKLNKSGYLAYEYYQQQSRAVTRLDKLENHAKRYEFNHNLTKYMVANKEDKPFLATKIKRFPAKSHPYIIEQAKAKGIEAANLWSKINLDAKTHSDHLFRNGLNPNERKIFDILKSYKGKNRQIAIEMSNSSSKEFKITDKVQALITERNILASQVQLDELGGVASYLKIKETKLKAHNSTANITDNINKFQNKSNFKEKWRVAIDIAENIKAHYPVLKSENISSKSLNKIINIDQRKEVLDSLSSEDKQCYKDVIKYKVLASKASREWKLTFNNGGSKPDFNSTSAKRAMLFGSQRDAIAYKINNIEHQLYLEKEGIKNDKLGSHAMKHIARLDKALSINKRSKELISQFHNGDACAKKQHAQSWHTSWNKLQLDAKKYLSGEAIKALPSELGINLLAIENLNKVIKSHGFFEQEKDHKTNDNANHHTKTKPEFYDLNRINEAVNSNIHEVYSNIFGEPKRKSSSELRYSGGLIITLSGPKKGLWYDFTEMQGGNVYQAIMLEKGVEFKDAVKIAAQLTGVEKELCNDITFKQHVRDTQEKSRLEEDNLRRLNIKSAKSIWEGCTEIKGTLAEKYLKKHRGVSNISNLNVKFWPKGAPWINVKKSGEIEKDTNKVPALVVCATNKHGYLTGVQRIYLDPKTAAKNNFFEQPKLNKGPTQGSACHLQIGNKNSDLYIAEGVETAASLALIKPNDHILVSLGQGNMKNAIDIINKINPRDTYILADNDGGSATSKSVSDTISNLEKTGVKPVVLTPKMLKGNTKTDWNDVLSSDGKSRLEKEIQDGITSKHDHKEIYNEDVSKANNINNSKVNNQIIENTDAYGEYTSRSYAHEIIQSQREREMEI